MADWIDELASALGEEPLSDPQSGALLQAARDVAHRTERRITPLSTFLLGIVVGRAEAGGATREAALRDALDRLMAVLPPAPDE